MKRKRAIQTITERLQANLLIGLFLSLSVICMATPQDSTPIISSDSYSAGKEAYIPLFLREEPLPEFPGGENAAVKYLLDNLQYPEEARNAGIEQIVYCTVTVNQDGSIDTIQIREGAHPLLEQEVHRVINNMPAWKTGKKMLSKVIQIDCCFPIVFDLKDIYILRYEHSSLFTVVDTGPFFPGGDEALLDYLRNAIRYPPNAQENGIQGRVVCSFFVSQDGSIRDVEVVRGLDPDLNREAVRVIEHMPRWASGKSFGRRIQVRYTVPVTFRLN